MDNSVVLLNSGIAPNHTAAVLNTRCVTIQATKHETTAASKTTTTARPGGKGILKKKLYREASPYGPAPEPFIFDKKVRDPFRITFYCQMVPLSQT